MRKHTFLFAYDIQHQRHRRKALKLLRAMADCYQDSVFDLRASSSELKHLQTQLCLLLDTQDSLMSVDLKGCHCWQLGRGLEPLTEKMLVIR